MWHCQWIRTDACVSLDKIFGLDPCTIKFNDTRYPLDPTSNILKRPGFWRKALSSTHYVTGRKQGQGETVGVS